MKWIIESRCDPNPIPSTFLHQCSYANGTWSLYPAVGVAVTESPQAKGTFYSLAMGLCCNCISIGKVDRIGFSSMLTMARYAFTWKVCSWFTCQSSMKIVQAMAAAWSLGASHDTEVPPNCESDLLEAVVTFPKQTVHSPSDWISPK